jgi:hypothetical protein
VKTNGLVEDWLENAPDDLPIHQIWHPSDIISLTNFPFKLFLQNGHELTVTVTEGWYSSLYGIQRTRSAAGV